jgi:cytidyltransferase-like protein
MSDSKSIKHGVFVGRFCPMHLGHEAIIRKMLDESESPLIVIGSSNNSPSMRHFFSYEERRNLIRKVFPDVPIVGLPDYSDDKIWLTALDDILSISGADPSNSITFFGGCEEDVRFFFEAGRTCVLTNRFDGSTPKISATEVRDALIHGRSLENLLNPAVVEDVKILFTEKWEKFKKM